MKHLKLFSFIVALLASHVFSSDSREDKWICEGYCFLGGDTPTNPFQPVSATGATEQEARDNIDCGPYTETGISCHQMNQTFTSNNFCCAR